jgi:FkbM family methyltransferase
MTLSALSRRVAERLSRGVVLRRHLPSEFQRLPLDVTPEAGLRHWGRLSQVDPHLFRMARELVQSGHVVWDVGANVGLFAFSAAARAGASGLVLAIEPDVWLAHLMNRSARRISRRKLAVAPVKVLCAVASSQPGTGELEIAERARASNHLSGISGSSQTGGYRQLQPTVSVTLDSLLACFPPPNLLKIDVESHEAEVLRGAIRLLENSRPVVWCEVDPANSDVVSRLFHEKDYRLFGAADFPHPAITRAWWNTLAIPAEKPVLAGVARARLS